MMSVIRNGEILIDFAIHKNIIINSTLFPHVNIHNGIWVSPDELTCNQIDHVLIEKRGATSILDVTAGNVASCGFDHFLEHEKFRCRISRQRHQGKQN